MKHFPHRFSTGGNYPDALALYRQVLAAQPDGSVVIVAVGPLRNLADLLKSDAPLIAKKVKWLHIMGGAGRLDGRGPGTPRRSHFQHRLLRSSRAVPNHRQRCGKCDDGRRQSLRPRRENGMAGRSRFRLDPVPIRRLTFSEETTRREFAIAQPAKFNCYPLRVTAADGKAGVQISTLELNQFIQCRPEVAVASLTLDQTALRLAAHTRATLNATLAPLNTFERQVIWTSTDPTVAEVRHIGEQTAIVAAKQPGTCTITETIGPVRQSCVVTVTPSTLPADWRFNEFSAPPIPGSVTVADNDFTLTGCGHAMTAFWERSTDRGAFVSTLCLAMPRFPAISPISLQMSVAPPINGTRDRPPRGA